MADGNGREENVLRARLAEQADRFDDMVFYINNIIQTGAELFKEERNLLSIGYKNIVGARRNSWRVLSTVENEAKTDGLEKKQEMIKKYRLKVEGELRKICLEVLGLLDNHLIPKTNDSETKIFYVKMKGDYNRYLAEVNTGEEKKGVVDDAQKAYQEAHDLARDELEPTNPIRLGLALNFSVFYYEINDSIEEACDLAKQALDAALDVVGTGKETSHDSNLILQLLKDNLSLWTPDKPIDGDD